MAQHGAPAPIGPIGDPTGPFKLIVAILGGLAIIIAFLARVGQMARSYSKREEAVELVPALETRLDSQDQLLAVMKATLDRLDRHAEGLQRDMQAIEARFGSIERDVSLIRKDVNGRGARGP